MQIVCLLIEDLHSLKNFFLRVFFFVFRREGGILKLPKFTKGEKQMSSAKVDKSRQIAHVRIYVERVIGRLRKFRILLHINIHFID